MEPTKKQLIEALAAMARGAELLHKELNLIQPFLSIYKNHGNVINFATKYIEKEKEK